MKVFCIIGDGRALQSQSPSLFNTVLARSGIKGVYVPFKVEPDQLGHAVQSLKTLNIAGANITTPYKESVIPYLDILSEGATIIGAVNTIVRNGDSLKGYNTNAIGFMDALNESGFNAEGKTALVVGTGGAAKAVTFILNWLRSDKIFVSGRNQSRLQRLVGQLGGEALGIEELTAQPLPVSLVVNATSVSDADEAPELAQRIAAIQIPRCEMVLDLNYGRKENFWQKLAQSRGIYFSDGLKTLAYQAKRSIALWTGAQIPADEFLRALP